MGKTKKGAGADAPARKAAPVPKGIVEAAVMGEVPGEIVGAAPRTEDVGMAGVRRRRGPQAGRRHLVRGFLESHPKRRAELEGEIVRTWEEAGGEPAAFVRASAEVRARVLSEAELDLARREAPRALSSMDSELSRYLTEVEGLSPRPGN